MYLIGGLIIGLGALLAKHFCTTGSVDPEILFINRNMFACCGYNRIEKKQPPSFLFLEKEFEIRVILPVEYADQLALFTVPIIIKTSYR